MSIRNSWLIIFNVFLRHFYESVVFARANAYSKYNITVRNLIGMN